MIYMCVLEPRKGEGWFDTEYAIGRGDACNSLYTVKL
jgi:hypothetical protein